MFAGLAPARRRLLLGILAVTVAAVLVGVFFAVRTALPSDPVPQDQPGPVLMVPGLGGSTTGLDVLASRLEADGRDVTVISLPGDGTGDLREQARVLDAAVDAALERTGAPSVDIVGYSAGGIVARFWLADLGGADVARRVLTLGSPHHGTQLASLAADVAPGACLACTQLAPDSDLLTQLNAADETPDGPEYVSIWTTLDETVTPPDSARLHGALAITVQSVCADSLVSHGELPRDRLVGGIVAEEIGADSPVQLSAADCGRLSS
ncbi:MAG: alpha/beta fold hydrolase [Geodermatophilaceae bacterium]|nr:alpha/beta fold hydrolase [Geodermatophilaceae bacterium]